MLWAALVSVDVSNIDGEPLQRMQPFLFFLAPYHQGCGVQWISIRTVAYPSCIGKGPWNYRLRSVAKTERHHEGRKEKKRIVLY